MGSLGWQDWSEFGNIGVGVNVDALGVSRTADREYKDTGHASVGTQYQINPRLRLNLGLGYDSSAVDDKHRTVDNPMGEAWRLATGVNYQVDQGLDVHAEYTRSGLATWTWSKPRRAQAPRCLALIAMPPCTFSVPLPRGSSNADVPCSVTIQRRRPHAFLSTPKSEGGYGDHGGS